MALVVDKKRGPYYTINAALQAASPKAIIELSNDIYIENIHITKPVTIKNKDNSDNVILIALKHPNILISVEKQD